MEIRFVNPRDKISRKYNTEEFKKGHYSVTIADDGNDPGRHRANVWYGNIKRYYESFDTRDQARMWAINKVNELEAEMAPILEESKKWPNGIYWVKERGTYGLVQFRKFQGVIQVWHFGWDIPSNFELYDWSSIRPANLTDPEGNPYNG